MLKNIFYILFIFYSAVSYSQVVFQITNNACDPTIEHTYNFETGSGAGWNTPNLSDTSNAVQGCMVLVNDGTTPGNIDTGGNTPHPTINDACDSTTWTQDLTGKIAVFYRGNCEYGLKAFNAQKRGAIAAICINHTGAAAAMGGGVYGVNVTIPTIMIGETDGNNLVACLDTICTNVEGYIGLEEYLINNDNIASNKSLILMTESSAMPWDLARNGTEYPIDLGLWIYNKGLSAQTGVTATVDIKYGGTTVHSNTSYTLSFAAPYTTYQDTQYVDLGTYAPILWNVGTYTITYTINNTGEQDTIDNQFTFEFKLTNNEDIYAKCRLDGFNKPIHSAAYRLDENTGPAREYWDACIHFRNNYAGNRNTSASGVTLSCEPYEESTMTGNMISILAYEWNDGFIDIYSPPTYNLLNLLDTGSYSFIDNSFDSINIYIPFNNPVLLQDNQRYLFCVRNYEDSLKTSYDTDEKGGRNYTTTMKHFKQPIAPLTVKVLGSPIEHYFNGIGMGDIPAISVTMDIATSINELEEEKGVPYPNPVTNLLTIPVRKNIKGNVLIEIFDLTGKLVLSSTKRLADEALKINVSSLSHGSYIFQLTFSNGSKDSFKVSVNR
jgi:hypothetical protein